MREWLIFSVLVLALIAGTVAFYVFMREVRGVRSEMREVRRQLEQMNVYIDDIAN